MWILLGPASMVKQVTDAAGHQYARNHQRATGQNPRSKALAEQLGSPSVIVVGDVVRGIAAVGQSGERRVA